MGNFQFIPNSNIHETIQDLDYYSKTLKAENERIDKQQDFIDLVISIIQKHKEQLTVNASTYTKLDDLHTEIAKLSVYIKSVDHDYQTENRQLAIDALKGAIETMTGKPYEANEKIMRQEALKIRLSFLNSELPYLDRKRNSMFAAPELYMYWEMYTYEKQKILAELSTM